jgi:hypothetical protein
MPCPYLDVFSGTKPSHGAQALSHERPHSPDGFPAHLSHLQRLGLLSGWIRSLIFFEGAFQYVGCYVQPATLGNHFPEVMGLSPVGRFFQDLLDHPLQTVCREIFYPQEFAYTVMGNPGGHTRLVKPDWYCHHWHPLSQ